MGMTNRKILRAARVAAVAGCLGMSSVACATEKPAVAPADGARLQAIIFGGGTAPEEAEGWLKRWQKARAITVGWMDLAEGFPRVVRSDDVAGLKPGFHVVLLGYCTPEEARVPLGLVKSLFPGTYVRDVKGEEVACPTNPREVRFVRGRSVESGGRRLIVNIYRRPPGTPEACGSLATDDCGEFSVHGGVLDADGMLGRVLEENSYQRMPADTAHPGSCDVTLGGDATKIVVHEACDMDAQPCSGNVSRYVGRTTYRLVEGRLDVKKEDLERQVMKYCD